MFHFLTNILEVNIDIMFLCFSHPFANHVGFVHLISKQKKLCIKNNLVTNHRSFPILNYKYSVNILIKTALDALLSSFFT